MKKAFMRIALLCISALLIFLLGCEKKEKSVGICLVTENMQYIIVINSEPVIMTDIDNRGLFDGVTTGDTIEIKHIPIRETYPAQTDIYSLSIDKTAEKVQPDEALASSLNELGYKIRYE